MIKNKKQLILNSLKRLYLIYTIIINQHEKLQDVWVLRKNLLLYIPIEWSFIYVTCYRLECVWVRNVYLLKNPCYIKYVIHVLVKPTHFAKWTDICKSVIFFHEDSAFATYEFSMRLYYNFWKWVAITKWHLCLHNKFQLTLLLVWLQGWKIITWWLFPGRHPLSLN